MVGGQLIRTQGTWIHYQANAEFIIAGDNAGEIHLTGQGELNFPFLGDTAQVVVDAQFNKDNLSLFYDHFHSKHAWWDKNMDNEFRERIEGIIDIPHTNTKITVGVENIKNFCYFQNTGIALPTSDGNSVVSNNVSPMQCSDNIQVVSANLRQYFKLGILHWENDITYQTCSHSDVLPLPVVSLYTNLYLRFKIAKVLKTEFGADMKYFTEYNVPDYSPVIGMFMNQNTLKKEKVGNYPLLSVYANFDLKRTRFYVMYHHFNQSDGRYFWLPNYPMNPASIRFGLSWNFYD